MKLATSLMCSLISLLVVSCDFFKKADLEIKGTKVTTTIPFDCQGNTPYESGAGTADNPYVICNQEQLLAINSETDTTNLHYKLASDLDLDPAVNTSPFTPIQIFKGELDGDGHKILNLTLTSAGVGNKYGFIREMDGATVKDIIFEDAVVDQLGLKQVGGVVGYMQNSSVIREIEFNGEVSGQERVGGIVGEINGGNVYDSEVHGDIIGSGDPWYSRTGGIVGYARSALLERVKTSGSAKAYYDTAGGIAGVLENSTVNLASSSSIVTNTLGLDSTEYGGIAGAAVGVVFIRNALATGNILDCRRSGGIVGINWSTLTIENSLFLGTTTYDGSCSSHDLGLVGYNAVSLTISDTYYNSDLVSSYAITNGNAATINNSSAKTTAELQNSSTFDTFTNIWTTNWTIQNGQYPSPKIP